MTTRILALAAIVLLAAAIPGGLAAQTRPERVQGRVMEPNGAPIGGALVEVTRGPDRLTLATRTDSAGAYAVHFAEGTGDYLVHVTAIGWQGFRQRVTRTGADSVLVVDAKLAIDPVRLAPVQAQTQRARPPRGPAFGRETGASEALAEGVNGALSPDQMGDLSQLAATTPGVTATPGGIVALGLAGQSSTTVNGMAFAGGSLPRDVRTRTRVSYSTYDPARGGFGSAQVNVEIGSAGPYTMRRGHLTVDAPQLQLSDAAAARLGQAFASVQASLGGEGELVPERLYYNAGVQASFRRAEAPSLLRSNAEVLRLVGVSPDSVARFLSLLSALQVPSRAGASSSSTLQRLSLLARVDHRRPNSERISGVTGFVNLSRTEPLAASVDATPGHGGESTSTAAGVQGMHSFYFGRGWLSETKSAFSWSLQRSTPYLALPEGRVRIASPGSAEEGGIASLVFGGNGALDADHRFWTWETTSEVQAYTRASRHKVKLFGNLRLDGDRLAPSGNRLGSFTYNSLADLEAGRPASFTRTLDAPGARGGEWTAALAVGDLWKHSDRFQLLYGLRFEGNRYTAAPELNPAVVSAFGVRNDRVPNAVHVSPRIGFTWAYGPREGDRMMMSQIGSRHVPPNGVVRGGIGEFRSFPRPGLLSGAQMRTGLAGSTLSLLCVGSAVPTPDWAAYLDGADAVPTRCADGSSGVIADASPPVELFSAGYRPARSWRANLGWTPMTKHVALAFDGVVSLNVDQPGWVDLNFSGVPRFALDDEGGRPVFVTPTSIVAATGAVSPVEARQSLAFGRVVERRSDLRSLSKQLTVTITPDLNFGTRFLSLAYTLGQVRALENGFSAGTAGNPYARFRAPGAYDIRHQAQLQAGLTLPGKLTVSLLTRVSSGVPYTPTAGGDVNGDGLANDRAFVFDPDAAADPNVAAGLQRLLDSAPGGARACLERQVGRVADANSCRGPWTVAMNARIEFAGRLLHTPRRMTVSMNVANPLAGADRLLHGASGLHGWGSASFPDPTLYYVRGFDPTTRRFRYEVNPRFGATSAAAGLVREPFRLTLDVRVDLGPSLAGQQVRLMLRPGRTLPGTRLTAAATAQRYARTVSDVYQMVLEQSDSLFLSQEQVREITAAQAAYRARADSVWLELGTYLAGLPERYDVAEALKRQEDATKAQWAIINEEGPKLKRLLSPLQIRLLGPYMYDIFEGRAVFGRTFVG